MAGTRLTSAGRCFSTDCRPVAGALVDFWHGDEIPGCTTTTATACADTSSADAQGDYRLETIVPAVVHRPHAAHPRQGAGAGAAVLTTQLYFPGEPDNESDGIFDQSLVMDVEDSAAGKAATFNFVLDVS